MEWVYEWWVIASVCVLITIALIVSVRVVVVALSVLRRRKAVRAGQKKPVICKYTPPEDDYKPPKIYFLKKKVPGEEKARLHSLQETVVRGLRCLFGYRHDVMWILTITLLTYLYFWSDPNYTKNDVNCSPKGWSKPDEDLVQPAFHDRRHFAHPEDQFEASETPISTATTISIPIQTKPSPVPTTTGSHPSSQSSIDNQHLLLLYLVRAKEDLTQQLIAKTNEVVGLETIVADQRREIEQLKTEVEEAKARDTKSAEEIRILPEIVANQKTVDADDRSNLSEKHDEEELTRQMEHVEELMTENEAWEAENEILKQCADVTDQNECLSIGSRIALKKKFIQKTDQFLEVKAEKQMQQQKVDFLSYKSSFVQDMYIVDLRQVICELAKVIQYHRLTPGYALRRSLDRLNLPFDAIVQTHASPYRWESAEEDTSKEDGSSERDTAEGESGSKYRHYRDENEKYDERGLATARYSRPLSNRQN